MLQLDIMLDREILKDPGNRFVADQTVTIWSTNVTTDENRLQLVNYHSSCSQNLDLKNLPIIDETSKIMYST